MLFNGKPKATVFGEEGANACGLPLNKEMALAIPIRPNRHGGKCPENFILFLLSILSKHQVASTI